MATWSGFFKQSSFKQSSFKQADAMASVDARDAMRAQMDPFRLRSLPNDDIYFFAKRIDNSKVIRQADPTAREEMGSAMVAAVLLMVLAVSIIMPKAAWMLEGYKLESLKQEHQTLLDQKRDLDVREARLLSPERLAGLAKEINLTTPGADQIVHLEGPEAAALAANRAPATVSADSSAAAQNH